MKLLKYILCLAVLIAFFWIWYVVSGLNYIPPHYHTNFALFIWGEKYDFTLDEFSEDIAACHAGDEVFPKDRVHLHENNWDTIHVHHWGVTWGHFFANNGITFSDWHISFKNGEEILINNDEYRMHFILNGKVISNPYNKYMLSEDVMLISYWSETDEELLTDFLPKVVKNAWEYNLKYDPGSCSGTNENSTLFLIKKMLHLTH